MSGSASGDPANRDPVDGDSVPQSQALESFIGKWRLRWPEWPIAEVFVPDAQRATVLAWAAMQQELTEAAWGGQDARPGEVKLGWWQEELLGWAAGRRRHPLGGVLQRHDAPWLLLSQSLASLPATRERARDAAEAMGALAGFSAAVAAVEGALFTHAGSHTGPGDADLVAATLLATRAIQPGDAHVPLSFLATSPDGAAPVSWRGQLLHDWPQVPASTRPRQLWASLARARLHRLDPALPLPSWRALMVAWRGARAVRN